MLWWTAQNALVSALLAAAVAVACRADRFSPAVKHALWLLVLVKLVTPPIAAYRLPAAWEARLQMLTAQHVPPPPSTADTLDLEVGDEWTEPPGGYPESHRTQSGREGNAESETTARFTIQHLPLSASPIRPLHSPALPVPLQAGDARRFSYLTPHTANVVLSLVWLAGAVPLAVVQFSRLVRLARLARHAAPAPDWLEQLVRQAASRLNVKPPEIAVVSAVCSPMICALGKPRLLWPTALKNQLTPDALEAILLHELAHLRRRDHWVAWLELGAGIAWWFNPVYWYVHHQLRENAELACDTWVVALLPAGPPRLRTRSNRSDRFCFLRSGVVSRPGDGESCPKLFRKEIDHDSS